MTPGRFEPLAAGATIDSAFDGGNGRLVAVEPGPRLWVAIEPDPVPGERPPRQWFCFRVHAPPDVPVEIVLTGLGRTSFPRAWDGYRALVSDDGGSWQRIETRRDGEALHFCHASATGSFTCAYYAPYSLDRHAALLARAAAHRDVRRMALGRTLDGRILEALAVGERTPDRPPAWIIARQHPGETMAEWFVEGLIDRLLDDGDPLARALRRHHVLCIVPCMNPDGAVRGHLRTNAAGTDLNRRWARPSLAGSPEVVAVREAVDATGVAFFLDVHGDESLPWTFTAGCEGVEGYGGAWQAAQEAFRERLVEAAPDYQTRHGYPAPPPGRANLALAANWVASRFHCPAFTLEMPFKDHADAPDPARGGAPARPAALGGAVLGPLLAHLQDWEGTGDAE